MVSVLATNRSCLLVRTLLRSAGFHRQPSKVLLWGLLHSDVCKSQKCIRYSVINNDFPKVVVRKLFFGFALFFRKTKDIFLYPAFSVSMGCSHSASRHKPCNPSKRSNMCDFDASTQAFVAKTGIVCAHWCAYIGRHQVPPCVLPTHVWKPA